MIPTKKSQAIWLCIWRHLVAKFLTNASGVTWWINFLLSQMAPPGGRISYLCKWPHLVAKFEKVEEKLTKKLKKKIEKSWKKVKKKLRKSWREKNVERSSFTKSSPKLNSALWLKLYFWARLFFTKVVSWRLLSAGVKTEERRAAMCKIFLD